MAERLTTYASLRLQVVDACIVAFAERLDLREGLVVGIGMPLADVYLEFLGGRCRPNTVLAYDLKVFFTVVGKPPGEIRPADVLALITPSTRVRPAVTATCGRWIPEVSRPR